MKKVSQEFEKKMMVSETSESNNSGSQQIIFLVLGGLFMATMYLVSRNERKHLENELISNEEDNGEEEYDEEEDEQNNLNRQNDLQTRRQLFGKNDEKNQSDVSSESMDSIATSPKKSKQKNVRKKFNSEGKPFDTQVSDSDRKHNQNNSKKQLVEKLSGEQLLQYKMQSFMAQKRGYRSGKRLKVLIATENKEKIQAIKNALNLFFPSPQQQQQQQQQQNNNSNNNPKIQVVAMKASSGIPHGQPWGLQHTFEGASARMADVKEKVKKSKFDNQLQEFDFIFSVENGVTDILTHQGVHGQDVACVLVEIPYVNKEDLKQQPVTSGFGGFLGVGNQANNNNNYVKFDRQFGFSESRPYPLSEVFSEKQQGQSNKEIGDFVKQYYQDKPHLLSRLDQIQNAVESVLKMFL